MDENDFDKGAELAEQELEKMIKDGVISRENVVIIGSWWKRNFMKAGHKRLGRLLKDKFAK